MIMIKNNILEKKLQNVALKIAIIRVEYKLCCIQMFIYEKLTKRKLNLN
jgi:hypothetical protein